MLCYQFVFSKSTLKTILKTLKIAFLNDYLSLKLVVNNHGINNYKEIFLFVLSLLCISLSPYVAQQWALMCIWMCVWVRIILNIFEVVLECLDIPLSILARRPYKELCLQRSEEKDEVSQSGVRLRSSQSGVRLRSSQSGVRLRSSQSGVRLRSSQSGVRLRSSQSGVRLRSSQSGVRLWSMESGHRAMKMKR